MDERNGAGGTRTCPNMVVADSYRPAANASIVITSLVGFFTIVGFIVGGYSFLDQRYALATNFVMLEKRVDINEVRHLYHASLSDTYFLREQARKHPEDSNIAKKLEESESETNSLKKRLDELKTIRKRRTTGYGY